MRATFVKLVASAALFFSVFAASGVYAAQSLSPDEAPDEYFRARVERIVSETTDTANEPEISQIVEVKIISGSDAGKTITVEHAHLSARQKRQKVEVGDQIILIKTPTQDGAEYYISDVYRLPGLALSAALFFLAVIAFGRWRGAASIVGLLTSAAVLMFIIIPLIIHGYSPVAVTLGGALLIACTAMFFAHGVSKQTTVAIVSTMLTLVAAALAAAGAIALTRLFGTGSEEAMYVLSSTAEELDIRGILLAGMIIGALGVLDDITTAQTAAAHELHDAKPEISFAELSKRVMRVGRTHIASLTNTLVLAYVGASLPLFLLFYTTRGTQPLWVVLNSQQISEELVRMIVGSFALVLAVPISTFLAAWYFTRTQRK